MQSSLRFINVGLIARPTRAGRSVACLTNSVNRTTSLHQPVYRPRPVRSAYSTSHQQRSRPRFFRFRPIPAFAALLLAQLLVVWDVSTHTDLFEEGNTGKFLSNSHFLPYTIVRKDIVSPNSCILTLRPGVYDGPVEECGGNTLDAWKFRVRRGKGLPPILTTRDIQNMRAYQDSLWREGIWSIEVKQPQMSITRQYTPLPPDILSSSGDDSKDAGVFRLFIRREPEGEVSRYLYGLPEGSTIELRGGFLDYQIPDEVRQLTFIAGGTGIAPALATAYGLALKQSGIDVRILWANRRREDCAGGGDVVNQASSNGFFQSLIPKFGNAPSSPGFDGSGQAHEQSAAIVRQLENMELQNISSAQRGFPRLTTKYYVDEEGSFIQKKDIAKALSVSSGRRYNTYANRQLVLVSGPDGFVEHIAGPKVLKHGQELQGPRGGLLAQIDLNGWEVWKL